MPTPQPAPFPKETPPTPERVRLLDEWLTSIEAFHPATAGKPWIFYEQLDAYLGPYELRNAAFDTHPKAYTEGGLTMVVLISPGLVPMIATIPRTEFRPSAPSFKATLKQVIDTSGIVVPQLIGSLLALAAVPAHNQMMSVASARDVNAFLADRAVSPKLAEVGNLVRRGRCDHLDVLARLRTALEQTTFYDEAADRFASQIVADIERRMLYLNHRYLRESVSDRELRGIFQGFDEDACRWRP